MELKSIQIVRILTGINYKDTKILRINIISPVSHPIVMNAVKMLNLLLNRYLVHIGCVKYEKFLVTNLQTPN